MDDIAAETAHLANPVICIVGPTATGKSALAQAIAETLDGEVISADSMQVYKGMDIGTGKVPESERTVAYHGIDLCSPDQTFSAALYQPYARSCFLDIDGRGRRSVLCGGSGLYIRAAIDDYSFPKGEQVGNAIRDRWAEYGKAHGVQALWDRLEERDPRSAALIHPHNARRVIRAFELLDDGTSYAEQHEGLSTIAQVAPAMQFGLAMTPSLLAQRIDERVDAMMEEGLLVEVEGLLSMGFRESLTAPQAIGYKEFVSYLEGETSLDEAVAAVKTATRRYAKRQRTWFRKDGRIRWLDADYRDVPSLLDEALCMSATMEESREKEF